MDQKQPGKGGFYFIPQLTVHHRGKQGQGTQGRNLEAGANAQTVEEHCLLACSPRLAWFALSQCIGALISIVSQENAP